MADKKYKPRLRRGGWLRRSLWIGGGLIVLLVTASLIVTSSAFFKAVILPRVSKAIHAELTVDDASLRPFSGFRLRNIQMKGDGQAALFTADAVRVQYSWRALLRGEWIVDEIVMESPVVQWVEAVDGTSNWASVMERFINESAEAEESETENEPPQLALGFISITNGTVLWVKHHKAGLQERIELSSVRLDIENVKNGSAGSVQLEGVLKVDQNPPEPKPTASMQSALEGQLAFELDSEFRPRSARGNVQLDVQDAGGALGELKNMALVSAVDWSTREIRELAIVLRRAGTEMGAIRAQGPYDLVTREGHLDVVLSGVDRQFLNLAGAPWGIQFNNTRITSTNRVGFEREGSAVVVSGYSQAADLSVTRMGQTTPETSVSAKYQFSIGGDRAEISELHIHWTPTERAANRVELGGALDYSDSDGMSGSLSMVADELDLTPLYDDYSQQSSTGRTEETDTGQSKRVNDSELNEPEPIQLPVDNFICDVRIDRLWLREIEITECMARLSIVDRGKVSVRPARLTINGALVQSGLDLDLGVTGWKYAVDLESDPLPLAPLVDSLIPDWRGQVDGHLKGNFEIRGAGMTDASLQKNLHGENSLVLTNASIQTAVMTNLFSSLEQSNNSFLRPAWRFFEPTSVPFKVLSPVLTSLSSKLGLGDLSDLPLQGIDARAALSDGRIKISCDMWGSAFALNSGGEVLMAGILTNSLIRDWPVNLALSKPLAKKIPYLGSEVPADVDYVPLPSLFRVGGTVGAPTASFDSAAFAQWTATSLLKGKDFGDIDPGKVLREVGDLFEKRSPKQVESSGDPPEVTDTQSSPLNELLQRLKRRRD